MKTCKDCIHSDICKQFEVCIKEIGFDFTNTHSPCEHFKDKNLFIELPVPLGTDVYYVNWEYTDDEYSDKRVWFVEKNQFATWMLDSWGVDLFATEEEALEQIEKEKANG